MTVEEALPYLKEDQQEITDRIYRGKYTPSPVRRVEIPKPDGGVRKLGIPTVVDRTLQQAITQQLVPMWESCTREERKKRALENLELVGLKKEYYDRHASELSGGECQRAAIARALMIEPEFLICDEITSALDVSVQAQIMDLFVEIQKKKKMTCLFISHDLALVSNICDRIAVMYDGKIVESGVTDQIIHHSSSDYTKKLLQSVFFADQETMTRYERKKREKQEVF